MSTVLILEVLDGVGPSEKYFLIKFIEHYPSGEECRERVIDLGRKLGVSDHVVSKGLKYGIDCDLITKGSVITEDGKRSVYSLSPNGRRYSSIAKAGCVHERLIYDLLEPDQQKMVDGERKGLKGSDRWQNVKRHPLNISQRLLLVILLGHANPCGVVRRVSKSSLCRQAGISTDRLESQLETLKGHGYLMFSKSGGTGKRLFGRVEGAYYLNLRQENYWRRGGESACEYWNYEAGVTWPKVADLSLAMSRVGKGGQRIVEEGLPDVQGEIDISKVAHYFFDRGFLCVPFMQMRAEEYIAFLINSNKEGLLANELAIDDNLYSNIRHDVEGAPYVRRLDNEEELELAINYLCYYLWLQARKIVVWLQNNNYLDKKSVFDLIPDLPIRQQIKKWSAIYDPQFIIVGNTATS